MVGFNACPLVGFFIQCLRAYSPVFLWVNRNCYYYLWFGISVAWKDLVPVTWRVGVATWRERKHWGNRTDWIACAARTSLRDRGIISQPPHGNHSHFWCRFTQKDYLWTLLWRRSLTTFPVNQIRTVFQWLKYHQNKTIDGDNFQTLLMT